MNSCRTSLCDVRLGVVATFVCALLLCLAPALQAAEPVPDLFELGVPLVLPEVGSPFAVQDAVTAHAITIDPELVASNPARLVIPLPDGSVLEAERVRFREYREDLKSWSGQVGWPGSGSRSGYLHLGYHGEQVTALLNFGEVRYQIDGGFGGPQRLVKIGSNGFVRCDVEHDHAGDAGRGTPDLQRTLAKLVQAQDAATATAKTLIVKTRIDVIVVYPKAFFVSPIYEQSVYTDVEAQSMVANDLFANSGVAAEINVVYIGPIIDPEPNSFAINDLLSKLTLGSVFAGVRDLRDDFGADAAIMMVPLSWDSYEYCGVARFPQSLSDDRAFSVQRLDCGYSDYTFAHEIGHLLAMRHDDRETNALYPYGFGVTFLDGSVQRATVMDCTCRDRANCPDETAAGGICDRILYFSDDSRKFNGNDIGDIDHRNEDVANAFKSYLADNRSTTNTPPTADFTVSCDGVNDECTFDADPSTGSGTLSYWWDFGDGSAPDDTSGQVATHSYSSGNLAYVRLVVTDGNGQQDMDLDTANY